MKASDLFVRCLEEEGVKYLFGIPGEENLDLLESLRKSSIELILTRHEQGAAFMAATYGRLTGKAGVALSTLGPGATNLITGVAYAQLGGMPLVVITGQKPIKSSKQGRFQIIDVVQTMRPLTKMAEQIHSAALIPSQVRQAFKLAENERPGAVHLELPEDIAREETETHPLRKIPLRRPAPDRGSVQQAADMIMAATRPLLMIAGGGNRKRISDNLEAFIHKTGIPFFVTQMGKGVLDERHEKYLGTAAITEGDYLHCAIDRADLIISIGHDVMEKPPAIMGHDDTADVIHFNFYPAEVDDVYFPTLEVIGDISDGIEMLIEAIAPQESWEFDFFRRMREETHKMVAEKRDSDAFPVIPQRLVCDLRRGIPDDGIITLDNGIYKIWIARNYPAFQSNTVLLDNTLASMGAGLPAAIAAKIARPERKVAAICGDGGFMMNSQELETAVRLGLDLVVVILNDSGYGMIKWKQDDAGFDDYGLDFNNPDFVQYAESYGAFGHRVTSADEFSSMLQTCLNTKGVHLLEVPMDYSENRRVLTEELRQKVCLI
jgi:acetolactate synthase-1/2/3 large subunit